MELNIVYFITLFKDVSPFRIISLRANHFFGWGPELSLVRALAVTWKKVLCEFVSLYDEMSVNELCAWILL